MKKIISILLTCVLMLNSFACTNTFTIASSYNTTNDSNKEKEESKQTKTSELVERIKDLSKNSVIQKALDGKTLNEGIKDIISNFSEDEINHAKQSIPDISFDSSNFANDEISCEWLAKNLIVGIKQAIENGDLTQNDLDHAKDALKITGVEIPNIQIKKGASIDDIEKLCIALVEAVNKMLNPFLLKIAGVNIEDPKTWEDIKKYFGIK